MIQLAITFGFVLITLLVPSILRYFMFLGIQTFMRNNRWLFWTCVGLTIGLSIAMFCFNRIARKVPINYICLFLFTLFSTYMIASICSYQSAEVVLIASALTVTVFIGLTTLTFFV